MASKPWHFKPGQSGNPGGRPKLSRDNVTAAEIRRLASKVMTQDRIERIFESILKRIEETGDIFAFDMLLNRIVGKVPLEQKMSHHHNLDLLDALSKLPPGQLIEMTEKTIANLRLEQNTVVVDSVPADDQIPGVPKTD